MAERVVLVTGCSSGIGLKLVAAFKARGWHVLAAVRDPARAPAELQGERIVTLDVADEAQIEKVARDIERLDCLVNNAGYALSGPFVSYGAEQMRRSFDVNVVGPALLVQALLPALKRASGRVINVSSVTGEIGVPMMSFYCAAKHAIEGLYESLYHELAEHGVQVALVEPGGFRTRFAANMQWGEREIAPGSVENGQLEAYRAMQKRLLARPGRDPAPVVEAIVKLAEMETMPLRTRVGHDAKSVPLLARWLPERVGLALAGRVYRRRMGPREET